MFKFYWEGNRPLTAGYCDIGGGHHNPTTVSTVPSHKIDCIFRYIQRPHTPPSSTATANTQTMALLLGEFIVMSGGFFVVFLILITCINAGYDGGRSDRTAAARRRRLLRDDKKQRGYYRH